MDLKISIDDEVYNHFLNNEYGRLDIIAVHNALDDAKPDIIRCKDCKYLERWRTPEQYGQFSHLYVCGKYVISSPSPDDYCSKAERKENQKFGKWVPISEGPPKEGETVIASTEYGVFPEAKYTKENGWEWAYESGADYWMELKGVEAWMPLPERYTVESENKDE